MTMPEGVGQGGKAPRTDDVRYIMLRFPSNHAPDVLAVVGAMSTLFDVAVEVDHGAAPVPAESGETLEPVWVSASDFVQWASEQSEYQQGNRRSSASYWGNRAWVGVLRVVVDAHNQGQESPLRLDRYPDSGELWNPHYHLGHFGKLDLRSLRDFIAQINNEAGNRSGGARDDFLARRLPPKVGPGIFHFWEKFTAAKLQGDEQR